MSPDLLRSLVWTDYRLALVFGVLVPLVLLVWSIVKKAQPISHLLWIYWRVSSLVIISVYLLIDRNPLGLAMGFASLILIPLSLWFWVDLNEEIADRRGPLKLAVSCWRWATTTYCVLSAFGHLPYLKCAASKAAIISPECQVWLEPPLFYKEMFHHATKSEKLGFIAIAALLLYGLYLGYFVLFRLTKQGRSATTV
jgi:Protein of unknown function (DUF3177)